MDAYVQVIRKASAIRKDVDPDLEPASAPMAFVASTSRIGPRTIVQWDDDIEEIVPETCASSSPQKRSTPRSTRAAAARDTAKLLRTLKDASNPITHSDLRERSDHVWSAAAGHQRSEDQPRITMGDIESRNQKLKEQRNARREVATSDVLKGVRAYLGFCETDTDIEMKRKIVEAGGSVTFSETSATHVISSQWLSGSKTQKFFTVKKRTKLHVVNPMWVTDSIEKGKRQPEWKYRQVENETQNRTMDRYFIRKSSEKK
ncbi:hypothetical protein FRC03_008666 [Tulasnella sp. 419]|nr:hypothetical protein FRC03_008666 [Tulasnella sp. 419]